MDAKLQEIRANIEKINKEYREIKGYSDANHPSAVELEDTMYNMMRNIYSYVDSVAQNMYNWEDKHIKNHAPAFKSAAQLKKFLKTCDMEDDYLVEPKVIQSSLNRQKCIEFEVDLVKKHE
jgi:hypothetical protein